MGVLWQVYLLKNTHIVLGHVVVFATLENKKREKRKFLSLSTQSRGRTGTGVNLLVFETSASTDSAIWASDFSEMVCKYRNYFLTSKIFMHFFSLSSIFGAVLPDAYTPYIVIT